MRPGASNRDREHPTDVLRGGFVSTTNDIRAICHKDTRDAIHSEVEQVEILKF